MKGTHASLDARRAALAVLALLGDRRDIALVEDVQRNPDLHDAATAALVRLGWRNGA